MRIVRAGDDVAVWAPAKVNLYLEILGKRPDGYHELATLMVAVRLFDTLVFTDEPAGELILHCRAQALSTGPDNLVMRAARLLREHTGCSRGARMRLVKRIPLAAGLAGGSTDAAATLAGLNRLWRLGLADEELSALAARLGSDVAFFLDGPAAWCTGRGEHVAPLRLGRMLDLVLVCPPVGLSTAEVYRNVDSRNGTDSVQPGDAIRQAVERGDIEAIGGLLHNRLQPAAERLCPRIADLQARLAELKPAGQLMSGSGSTVFALCRDPDEAQTIARALRRGTDGGELKVFQVRSCS